MPLVPKTETLSKHHKFGSTERVAYQDSSLVAIDFPADDDKGL